MTTPSLRIPTDFVEVAESVSVLSDEVFESLVLVLKDYKSQIHRSGLAAQLDRLAGWDGGTSDQMLSMVASLRHVGQSLGQGLEDNATLAELISKAPNLPEPVEREVFRARIKELLESAAINLIARAEALLDAHEHRLSAVQILSDIRPLFDAVDERRIDGVVIGHLLRLSLIGGGQPASFDVALDLEDLKNVRRAVDRAFRKQEQLEQVVAKSDLVLIVPYDVKEDTA